MAKKLQNKRKLRKLYRFMSKPYDWFMKYWNKIFAKSAEKDLDKFVKKNFKGKFDVLDLACGTGVNIERLKKWKLDVGNYRAVDLSPDMQKKAKEKAGWIKNKEFLIDDITKYDPGKKFDLIICTWALSHMDEPAKLVNKYFDYLKKGGYMIFIFQGELKGYKVTGKVLGWIEGLFNAELVLEAEMKKFPKAIGLNKNYLGGFVRLYIFNK